MGVNIINIGRMGIQLPIIPTKVKLDKFAHRKVYSKSFLERLDNIKEVKSLGNYQYVINTTDDNVYYLNKMSKVGMRPIVHYDSCGIQGFILYSPDKMMAVIMIADVLENNRFMHRFVNDAVRAIFDTDIYDKNFDISYKIERNKEGSVHEDWFSCYEYGVLSETTKLLMQKGRGEGYYVDLYGSSFFYSQYKHGCYSNRGDLRDFSEIYHMNDSLFFVGTRGQMFELVFKMINNNIDFIPAQGLFDEVLYKSLHSVDSGIIPSYIENVVEYAITNTDGARVPIIEGVGDDQYVFYKHNFGKYQSEILKQMNG